MANPLRKTFIGMPLQADTQDLYHVRASIQRAIEAALPGMHGRFLDIGCGTMPYKPLILAPPAAVAEYIGMDLPVTAEAKYQGIAPDISWDGRAIPLPDASIDSAMATEVLEHCPDPLSVLREVARVLKPGAQLLVTVPFLWPLHDAPYDEHRYTPYALDRLLREAGFTAIAVRASGGWDASLAQMIGLWVMRRPMPVRLRGVLKHLTLPVVRFLLRRDRVPQELDWLMITALSATARKA